MSQPNDHGDGSRGDGSHTHMDKDRSLKLRMAREELMLRQRYESASVVNDILIALWFLAGSVMFFFSAWQTAGTWCFVIGSVELLVRPVIRLSRRIHLQRRRGGGHYAHESPQDF
ncbi:YrhK family protein [Streptomyces ovatisporus]|uniref:YrhK family protein n=1 Tax=Streptomyces ovatisporus TaxID=1128682 RepID=A0ABV9ABZ1_9ACTN